MSSDQKSDVPGGYFVGHPTKTNQTAEKTEEPPHAAGEQNPATTQPPGDYFVGRPESQSHHKMQQEAVQQQTTKQSTPSFLAKCCPCLAGGGAAE